MLPPTSSESAPATEPVFARIALSMSGGGFRAAAYSLGTLSALHKLGLLDRVHMLSTISGGTFTGMYYAMRRKQGADFQTIYREFSALLESDGVLPNALQAWQQTIGSGSRDYKLIRAFADEYHQSLFGGQTFELFWQPDPVGAPPFPLQTLVFGATELYTGVAFRFQYAQFPTEQFTDRWGKQRDNFLIGNGNVHILPQRARALRLADIVASSSCFPVGFEPLEFPADYPGQPTASPLFMGQNETPLSLTSLAIVDGGVYDNQGIEGLLLANRRNRAYCASPEGQQAQKDGKSLPKPSTLFLIADVASAETDLYEGVGPAPLRGSDNALGQWGRTFETLKWALVGLLMVGVLIPLGYGRASFLSGMLAGVSAVGILLILVGQRLWTQFSDLFRNTDARIHALAIPPLLTLTISQLGYLLKIRAKTAFTLLLSVFLRRVRSLNYDLLYTDEEGDIQPQANVLPSIVGSILRDYENPSFRDQLRPVYETVLTASKMPTTLWWLNDKFRYKALVESGEITLAWRIMRFFARREYLNQKARREGKPEPHPIHPDDRRVWEAAEKLFRQYAAG